MEKKTQVKTHNEECRQRIQTLMEQNPEGAERVEKRRNAELEVMNEHYERQVKARRDKNLMVPEMPSDGSASTEDGPASASINTVMPD